MKISLSWIKEFIEIDLSPVEIGDVLTLAGLEVDGIEDVSPEFTGIVVGRIDKTLPHPNADRLRIAQVFDGEETFQVVCGAPNCREGTLVPFAKIGATLQDEKGKTFKIKQSKLRDVESFGMLCGEDELGLGEDTSGLLELDPYLPLGTDLKSLYADTVYEISLTPNLGHCMSAIGVARELSAMLNVPLKYPSFKLTEDTQTKTSSLIQVKIHDPNHCNHYGVRILKNVKTSPSPQWLKTRLENSGVRSINLIVDVTNYVMLEYGQPMHAFDLDKIKDGQIHVKMSKKPLSFKTLDGEDRSVPENTLLIEDKETPLALAGIMGGEDSSVTDSTTSIVLEAAYFDPITIRKGSKALALRSESSARFEKEIDPLGIRLALDRAAYLLQDITGATVCEGIESENPKPFVPKELTCRASRINRLLGTNLSQSEVESLLTRLGLVIAKENEDALLVKVPSFRNDIKAEIDLVEEVARIYGYNNIDERPLKPVLSSLPHSRSYLFSREVRSRLTSAGLQEFLTCDLLSPEEASISLGLFSNESPISVLRPSSVDQSALRATLLPGMLKSLARNQDFKWENIAAFEIGNVHINVDEKIHEHEATGILLSGSRAPHMWGEKALPFDFYDLKGYLENIFDGLDLPPVVFTPSTSSLFHPHRQAILTLDNTKIGILGELHPTLLRSFSAEKRAFYAEINLGALLPYRRYARQMTPLPQYPSSERDWTLTIDSTTPIEALYQSIDSSNTPLLKQTYLLDVFESEKIGADQKNVTFRFVYRDDKKTVSMQGVDKAHTHLQTYVREKLGLSLHAS